MGEGRRRREEVGGEARRNEGGVKMIEGGGQEDSVSTVGSFLVQNMALLICFGLQVQQYQVYLSFDLSSNLLNQQDSNNNSDIGKS